MPLSDHEQRLLEQMERALAAEDPKLASSLQGADLRHRQRRRAVVGVVVFVLGMIMLFGGAVMMTAGHNVIAIVVSVLGFVVMLLSAYFVAISLRRMPAAGEVPNVVPIKGDDTGATGRQHGRGKGPGRKQGRPRQSGESFMSRLEERWRRRRDSGGG